VQAVKAVKQEYSITLEIQKLLETFRLMLNDCIHIGIAENVTSLKTLSLKAYRQLSRYDTPSVYKLTAISKATGVLSNYRRELKKNSKAKIPFAKKLLLIDCYSFVIKDGLLRISLGYKHFAFIPLESYVLKVISGYSVRSILLTACTLSITFSKEIEMMDVTGLIGIDRNLDNVTTSTLEGRITTYDLSKSTEVKAMYREVKSHFKRNDARIRQKVYGKYGKIQRNKVNNLIHCTSKDIVKQAKDSNSGIVLENLKGIRRMYRKGNGQGKPYRSKLNSWSFYELQRQVMYKAKWLGIPVIYVHPAKTSSTCAICGFEITKCTERKVYCHKCNITVDRDENAALNIVKTGLRFSPKGGASEAMGKESPKGVILLVDASQLTKVSRTAHEQLY
jgi:putative transposase